MSRPGAGALLLWVLAVPSLACRQVLGIDDRSSDGLPSGATTATQSTTIASSATGGGGGGGDGTGGGAAPSHCSMSLFSTVPSPSCTTCLKTGATSCCQEVDACAADPACVACLAPDGFCTAPPVTLEALSSCVRDHCGDECYPAPPIEPEVLIFPGDLVPATDGCVPEGAACNPMRPSVTCGYESGTACDVTPRSQTANGTGFACYLSNRRHIGESCGLLEGSCHFGLTCANYTCARMCCTDADCGDGGACDPAWIDFRLDSAPGSQAIGICVVPD